MPDERDLPGGQRQAAGWHEHDRGRRLQGILVLARGPELDRSGLRRQWLVRSLPAVELRPDGALGAVVDLQNQTAGAAAARQSDAAPARHPPGVSLRGAAV